MKESTFIISAITTVVIIVGSAMIGIPKYSVWTSTLSGEAELKHAEWNRQIAVREAEAKRDSAKLLAEAEVERAKGVAQANQIIGDSLKENEQYLRYLWIDSLAHTKDQIIYIPTEAGMPILESGRPHNNKILNIAKEILR